MTTTIRSSHGELDLDPEWLVNQIAHALRNPIFAAMVQAEALKLKASGDETIVRSASMVHGQLKRLEGDVGEMLLLGRPAKLNPRQVELGPVVTGLAEAFCKSHYGDAVDVTAEIVEPQRPIATDPDAVVIVLERLIRNAAQHSEPSQPVEVVLGAPATEHITISVRDHGSGVPEALCDRIFLPFFPQHGGRPGLGLSVAAKFAHALGGGIELETEPGVGTEARFVLPVAGRPTGT